MNGRENSLKIRDMAYSGMFAAVIAVMSQISLPMPSGVPVTLQTFAVALAGFTLGAKRGFLSAAVYVLIGAAGAPVFSQFRGGLASVTGITGGFIWGFMIMAALCGLGADLGRKWQCVLFGISGLISLHLCGAAQFTAIKQGSFTESLMIVSLPFMLKDALSVISAIAVAEIIRKRTRFLRLDI